MKLISSELSKYQIYQSSVIGVVWGVIEITIGNGLHIAKIPFRGLFLSFIAAILLSTGKKILDYKGSLVVIGVICATVKTLSTGAFLINPIVAIILESVLAEIVFIILKRNTFAFLVSGVAVLSYTLVHSIAAQIFFMGGNIIDFYQKTFSVIFGNFIEIDNQTIYQILFIYVLIHIVIGLVAGYIGLIIGNRTLYYMQEAEIEKIN